jgi:hypothetical protein
MSSIKRDIIGLTILSAVFMGFCIFIIPKAIQGEMDFADYKRANYIKQTGQM